MKKHKLFLEIIVFALVLVIMGSFCYNAVRKKDTGNGGGLEQLRHEKAKIDVMAFGTSHAGCTVNNAIMWREYGISSYTIWSGSQSVDGTYQFMADAFRYQKPKVALVETLDFVNEVDYDRSLFLSGLTTRFSPDYVKYVLKIAREKGYSRQYTQELLFKFPAVHSRYKELTKDDFYHDRAYNRGYQGSNEVSYWEAPEIPEGRLEIPAYDMYYIEKIVELCRENNVELVLFHAPFVLGEEHQYEQELQNTLADYCRENGVTFLDYYRDYAACDIDFATDLREGNHLNDAGAAKVTRVLSQYLKDNYDIPDHRGEAGYDAWDLHARFIDDRQFGYELQGCENINDYLSLLSLKKDDYSIVVTMDGNYKAIEGYAGKPLFGALGLGEVYDEGGFAFLQNGSISGREAGESYSFYKELKGKTDLNIYKKDGDEFAVVSLGEKDYSPICNGFTVTVYDEPCNYVIDSIYVDVYSSDTVLRHED